MQTHCGKLVTFQQRQIIKKKNCTKLQNDQLCKLTQFPR